MDLTNSILKDLGTRILQWKSTVIGIAVFLAVSYIHSNPTDFPPDLVKIAEFIRAISTAAVGAVWVNRDGDQKTS